MATREDVILDFAPDIRIAVVESPSLEFTIQDIVDTLRKREDTFQGTSQVKLIDASGKEDLGGGVAVGITAELQETQIAFEGRTDPAQTGTVTTDSVAPVAGSRARANGIIDLHDINATFLANNIARGSLVVNFTDQSIAEVYEVISEIHLVTRTLVNGIDNSFDTGDVYHVFNIVQCELIGGNLLGVDGVGDITSPVTPTAFTQVIRTGSSSATLVSQTTLEHSAFHDAVTYDVINGVAGTEYPIGTGFLPSNNLADTKIIGLNNNLRTIKVTGNITIGATDNIDNLILVGDGIGHSFFTFVAGCSTGDTTFVTAEMTGDLSGAITAQHCSLHTITGIGCTTNHSNLLECEIVTSTLQIRADNNQKIHLSRCESGAAGISTPPILDLNGSAGDITVHKFAGTMQLSNATTANQISFDTSGGAVTINPSCTLGTITIGGATKLIDNSGAGFTVINNTSHKLVWDHDSSIFLPNSMGEIQRRTAYQGAIHLDVNNGVAGTTWPLGTADNPVNNISDASTIGNSEGIFTILVAEDVTVFAADNIDGFVIKGAHATKSEISVQAGASTTFTEFRDCQLTGTMAGQIVIRDSFATDVLNFEGVMFETLINGEISLAGTQPSYILSCYSGNPNPPAPEINFNGTGQSLVVRAYSGALKFVDKSGPEFACIDFVSGKLVLDGTVTNGTITVRGTYDFVDNSSGTTINRTTNLDVIEFKIDNIQTDVDAIEVTLANVSLVIDDLIKYQRNKSVIDPIAFTLTIYEDDDTTPLTVFDLKDSAGIASVTSIFQRIPL